MNTKVSDTNRLLSNIPDERCMPYHRSELRRLYKRLEARLRKEFNFIVKEKALPAKVRPGNEEQDERELLTKKCRHLIKTLKTCIKLHSSKSDSMDP